MGKRRGREERGGATSPKHCGLQLPLEETKICCSGPDSGSVMPAQYVSHVISRAPFDACVYNTGVDLVDINRQ